MGLSTLILGSVDLPQGYLEGRFHAVYVYYANIPFNPLNGFYLMVGVIAVIVHQIICTIQRTGVFNRRRS